MANTYLERIIEAGSVGRTFTYSVWFKRTKTGTSTQLWNLSSDDDSSKYIEIAIKSDDKLDMQFRNGTSGDNGTYIRRIPTRVFRDSNAFYHVVLRFDSTESSADDRFRLYINGEQETSFSTSTGTIPQNYVTDLANTGGEHRIGRGAGSSSVYWDGSMSHFNFVDGVSYGADTFGSTDATTGEWKINTSPSISTANYGTNGFFILKNGNSVTDQSGNSHNFTVAGGTLTNTEDNPSNVFAILNSITPSSNNNQYGGTRHFNNSGGYDMRHSTLAVTTGKYYSEFKITQMSGGFTIVGIQDTNQFDDYNFLTNSSRGYGYRSDGTKGNNNSSSSFGNSFTSGDTIGVAIDLDNNKIYFSKNGVWQNSGDPTSGATGTGSAFNITDGYDYCIATSSNDAGTDQVTDVNFGNGYFNVTAVSSAGTNASGIGIFEYDVPTGYTALSTKGLNL